MSGADIPYQLRPNKHIERQLFWELLERISNWRPIRDMGYISMGSKFLEDFRQIHSRFDTSDMVSIESDFTTYKRQCFNKPIGCLDCKNMKSGDLVTNFEKIIQGRDSKNFIVWLDYTAAKGRVTQLSEFESLISKLTHGDIIKITLNANLSSFCKRDEGEDFSVYQQRTMSVVERKLNQYFPKDKKIQYSQMTRDGIASILGGSVRVAATKGLQGSPSLIALPLASFLYNDGYHDMMTVTCMIINKSEQTDFLKKTEIKNWLFYADNWEKVEHIGIPDLSMKERLHIDAELVKHSNEEIHASLPFAFSDSAEESLGIFQQYALHHRRYPAFIRAAI